MKRYAIGGVLVAGILAAAVAQAQTIQVSKDNRTISVTTSATASAEADVATVNIGFVSYGADQQSAYAEGSKTSNAIAKALAAEGVAKDAIQSESQNISGVQPYELNNLTPEEKAQRKFKVQQSWSVKTAADNAAKILDVAVKAGANQSGNIDWSVKSDDALQAEAASKALARARSIASQMAAGLGAKIGELLYASNQVQEIGPRPMMAMAKAAGPVAENVQPLAINPRKVERSATVHAVFAIE
jgi:uncharacterized protein YggE